MAQNWVITVAPLYNAYGAKALKISFYFDFV